MFDDYQICPYTGLRSFTEEESLYFKGREDHIQHATEQLQRNKFLMLTGASGDGKSSLVYAGIIPNARAGFLKSKYTQWCVADFRPERTPFKNLCRAVARQLEIANADTVESELQHGFSALADLYRNSPRFIDVDSVAWTNADDRGKATLKRQAANLIILVDQFEEFFTNPENYHNGVPSRDSNLVLNVLLETARIALEENLPIYIVFTMRSDYIGQCAAFRSLPEYIGFSQFFVPRLNRSQLQQVIEEPASLSGNRISRRLTERLIHDIAEGVDQLPILQHALNQIWHSANKGSEEMDLIHYAMVGGISPLELPDDHSERFAKWYESLPVKIKAFYREPNLQNVLDTHANKLYESAAESYRSKTGGSITDDDAKAIVKTAFTCLTKIDQSRAVRNRMTLLEITHILGKPELDAKQVGEVLNIFREPGNTFIRPFVTDEPESNTLKNSDVLDITHESLIRNWEYLGAWAKEEFDNYAISLDYEKQLERWVNSGKDSGFLLSIGPLTYFESWYNKVNPNAWWIARYLPEDIDQDQKLEKANAVLDNSRQFLRLSARKHMVTRTIIRYGPRRIVALLAIVGFLTMSSFMVRNYIRQQNDFVLNDIKGKSLLLANSKKVRFYEISGLLLEGVKFGSISHDEIIDHIGDSIKKINIAVRMAGELVLEGRNEPKQEILGFLSVAEKHLGDYPLQKAKTNELKSILKEVNYLRNAVGIAGVYNPSEELLGLRIKVAQHSAAIAAHILSQQPKDFKDINALNVAIENGVNYKAFTPGQVDWILETLSPFELKKRTDWVLKSYGRESTATRSTSTYHFKFNGLFQELAYLYASKGNASRTLQCIDSLLLFNQGYYQNDYSSMQDNATNIATVFYLYGEYAALDDFVKGFCDRKKITQIEFYQRWIGRCLVFEPLPNPINEFVDVLFLNLNCQLSDERMLVYLFSRYREFINKITQSPDERNYLLALAYKDEGIIRFHHQFLAHNAQKKESMFSLLDTAFQYYRQVNPAYLDQEINAITIADNDAKLYHRSFIFLFPDYRPTFSPFEPRNYFYSYTSSFFVEYLLKRDLLNKYYDGESISCFPVWLEALELSVNTFDNGWPAMRMKPDMDVMIDLESRLAGLSRSNDLNLLYLRLGNEVADRNDNDRMSYYFRKLDFKKMPNLERNTTNGIGNNVFRRIGFAVKNLCAIDSFQRAYDLINLYKKHENRVSLYAFAAKKLVEQKINKPIVQQLLDSARMEMTRIEAGSNVQFYMATLSYALSLQDPYRNRIEAERVVKNFGNKFWTSQQFIRSFAFHGNLYDAESAMIQNISDGDQTVYFWNILRGYTMGMGLNKPEWQEFDRNYVTVGIDFFILDNEN